MWPCCFTSLVGRKIHSTPVLIFLALFGDNEAALSTPWAKKRATLHLSIYFRQLLTNFQIFFSLAHTADKLQ